MKNVVCLIVYGDHKIFKYRFENFFNNPNINYIIHYNKRDYLEYKKLKSISIFQKKNIYLFSEIEVYWGDVSILDAELKCIEKAINKFPNFNNLIILDGKSLPCRSWDYIMNKIDNFDGNWLNINHKKYPKWSYCYNWFESQEFYSKLILNLEKPAEDEIGSWWLVREAKKNFKTNIKEKFKKKSFFKWLFLYIRHYLFFSLENKRHAKFLEYYLENPIIDQNPTNNLLNIIGPNLIISKRDLMKMIEFDSSKEIYNKITKKHAPEEIYFNLLYIGAFGYFEAEKSNNAFIQMSSEIKVANQIKKNIIKKKLTYYDDLLFVRKYYTIEEMKKFKKRIFID